MSQLEKLCCDIDEEKCTDGHFIKVFQNNLAPAGIFSTEDLLEFTPEKWGETFKLGPGQVVVLKKYVLVQKNIV